MFLTLQPGTKKASGCQEFHQRNIFLQDSIPDLPLSFEFFHRKKATRFFKEKSAEKLGESKLWSFQLCTEVRSQKSWCSSFSFFDLGKFSKKTDLPKPNRLHISYKSNATSWSSCGACPIEMPNQTTHGHCSVINSPKFSAGWVQWFRYLCRSRCRLTKRPVSDRVNWTRAKRAATATMTRVLKITSRDVMRPNFGQAKCIKVGQTFSTWLSQPNIFVLLGESEIFVTLMVVATFF